MGTTLPRLPVRVSPGLRDLVAQAGPVNAATRALLLLGAHAAGLDLWPVAGEVWALAGLHTLAPGLRAALTDLAGSLRPGGVTGDTSGGVSRGVTGDATFTAPAAAAMPALASAEPAMLLDELLGVGIEV